MISATSKRNARAEGCGQRAAMRARSKPQAMRARAPVRVDRADNLNECRTVDISPEREAWARGSVAPRDAWREAVRQLVNKQQGNGRAPVALDGNVCTISCLYTRHIRAAILHTAYKSNLLSCANINMNKRQREGKCYEDRKGIE